MTQEDKELLLTDLCARLPYGVKVTWDGKYPVTVTSHIYCAITSENNTDNLPKLLLRSMSSMTLEELEEYRRFSDYIRDAECKIHIANYEQIHWLNAHYFDYRGLIEKGLALEAPEGMYY